MRIITLLLYSLLFSSSLFSSYFITNEWRTSTNGNHYNIKAQYDIEGKRICGPGIGSNSVVFSGSQLSTIRSFIIESDRWNKFNCPKINNGNNLIGVVYNSAIKLTAKKSQGYCSYSDNSWGFFVDRTYPKREICEYDGKLPPKTCTPPQVWNTETEQCEAPPCKDEDTILPVPQNMCYGTFNNADKGIRYGELYYQTCDNTCRGVFTSFYTCNELILAHLSSCSLESNTLEFSCVDIDDGNGGKIPNLQRAECVPKKKIKTNPCDDLYKNTLSSCNMATHIVIGYPECSHNGKKVTNDTIKCVIPDDNERIKKPDDCNTKWYEKFNESTKKCECQDNYKRNKWGECWKNLDSNSTKPEIDKDKKEQDKSGKEKEKNEADKNATKRAQTSNKNIEDILSGIRLDLNTTNSLLSNINDKNTSSSSSSSSGGGKSEDSNTSKPSDSDCMSKGSFKEILDCYKEASMPEDFFKTPKDWYKNNKLILDIELGSNCKLETFKWTMSNKVLEFPPRDFVTSLPLEKVAGFFIALLYIGGLRDFLKT
ncbi:hypothetical protein [Sulfurimonas sp.]|uniref:hypothetical protein n=1 Tax=Sulfurimonas sp. TaxID=2022749 RepID=UPI002B4623C6|nr:hypothetical protein [Sulfurimonas sp.]